MTRYRRVETGTFQDDRFVALEPVPPGSRYLWLTLLCGTRTTVFPGLVVATEAVLSSDLEWPIGSSTDPETKSLRGAWARLEEQGMAVADWIRGAIVLPKALRSRRGTPRETARPTSPNAFRGWARAWSEVPECPLSAWYLGELGRFAMALDDEGAARGGKPNPYQIAFENAFAAPIERAQETHGKAFRMLDPLRLGVKFSELPVVNASGTRSRRVYPEQLPDVNASGTRSGTRLERVDPNQSQVVSDETITGFGEDLPCDTEIHGLPSEVNASGTRTRTRSRPARDPVPVPESEPPGDPGVCGLRSSLDFGIGSGSGFGSGSDPVLAPVIRPTERSSAAPRRGYPPRVPVAQAQEANGSGTFPGPLVTRASATGTAESVLPSAEPVVPSTESSTPVRTPYTGPGAVVPSAEDLAFRDLRARVWAKLDQIRRQMALEFAWRDFRALQPMDPGVGELNARLRESGASGEELAFHVLAIAEAEARAATPPTGRWLTGALFRSGPWHRRVSMRLADVGATVQEYRRRSTKPGEPDAPERAAAAAALARERAEAVRKKLEPEPEIPDEPLTESDYAELRSLALRVARNPAEVAAELRAEQETKNG